MFHCIRFEKVFPLPTPRDWPSWEVNRLLLFRHLQKKQSRPQGPSSLATAESCPLGSLYSPADFLSPLVLQVSPMAILLCHPLTVGPCPHHPCVTLSETSRQNVLEVKRLKNNASLFIGALPQESSWLSENCYKRGRLDGVFKGTNLNCLNS